MFLLDFLCFDGFDFFMFPLFPLRFSRSSFCLVFSVLIDFSFSRFTPSLRHFQTRTFNSRLNLSSTPVVLVLCGFFVWGTPYFCIVFLSHLLLFFLFFSDAIRIENLRKMEVLSKPGNVEP